MAASESVVSRPSERRTQNVAVDVNGGVVKLLLVASAIGEDVEPLAPAYHW